MSDYLTIHSENVAGQIYIIGNLYNALEAFEAFVKQLKKDDILIIAGDVIGRSKYDASVAVLEFIMDYSNIDDSLKPKIYAIKGDHEICFLALMEQLCYLDQKNGSITRDDFDKICLNFQAYLCNGGEWILNCEISAVNYLFQLVKHYSQNPLAQTLIKHTIQALLSQQIKPFTLLIDGLNEYIDYLDNLPYVIQIDDCAWVLRSDNLFSDQELTERFKNNTPLTTNEIARIAYTQPANFSNLRQSDSKLTYYAHPIINEENGIYSVNLSTNAINLATNTALQEGLVVVNHTQQMAKVVSFEDISSQNSSILACVAEIITTHLYLNQARLDNHGIARDKKVIITRDIVNMASHAYQQAVLPFYNNEAARIIQRQFRRKQALKQYAKKVQDANNPIEKHIYSTIYRRRKAETIKFKHLIESIDDNFQEQTKILIKNNQYDHLNYSHPDFTRHLFAMLRIGIITMNELLTAKLMYDSLFCFNKDQIPSNPSQQFRRYQLSDPTGPYQPHEHIAYWDDEKTQHFQAVLNNPSIDQKTLHYYTIDLPRHQMVGLLYLHLSNYLDSTQFISKKFHSFSCNLLQKYAQTLESLTQLDTQSINEYIEVFQASPIDAALNIQRFIIEHEAELATLLIEHPSQPINVDKQSRESSLINHSLELGTLSFMNALMNVDCQVPMFCFSPHYNASNPQSPLLSFILLSLDAFNILQQIAHGAEYVEPIAVIGEISALQIRAYDELPTIKNDDCFTEAQTHLAILYPQAAQLTYPSRPIEVTYPNVKRAKTAHGLACYDLILSWHDILHTWRNGSNDKALFRKLRHIHDEKAGFAITKEGMSRRLWPLSDMDCSAGQIYKGEPQNSLSQITAIIIVLEAGGYSLNEDTDDNYLFLYSLCQSPDEWRSLLFSINPQTLATPSLTEDADFDVITFNRLKLKKNQIQTYLSMRPQATIVEIILHDLLTPVQPNDTELLNEISKLDLKSIFYWAKNTQNREGIYFYKTIQKTLQASNPNLHVELQVRKNTAQQLRAVLSVIVSSEQFKPKPFTNQLSLRDKNKLTFFYVKEGNTLVKKSHENNVQQEIMSHKKKTNILIEKEEPANKKNKIDNCSYLQINF